MPGAGSAPDRREGGGQVRKRSRKPLGIEELRSLGLPDQLDVLAGEDGSPRALRRAPWRAPRAVDRVQDRWRIDDEWWRERPVSRMYFVLLLKDGSVLTVYQDLVDGTWYEQRP